MLWIDGVSAEEQSGSLAAASEQAFGHRAELQS
jgi:hypothetical protein